MGGLFDLYVGFIVTIFLLPRQLYVYTTMATHDPTTAKMLFQGTMFFRFCSQKAARDINQTKINGTKTIWKMKMTTTTNDHQVMMLLLLLLMMMMMIAHQSSWESQFSVDKANDGNYLERKTPHVVQVPHELPEKNNSDEAF